MGYAIVSPGNHVFGAERMFSFFKKKQNAPNADVGLQKMRREVDNLRAELGDEALVSGMQLLDKVSTLGSVKLPFFQGLMDLTFEISDQVVDQYEPLGDFNPLEVHGFCACIVATAISVINLPDDEKLSAMDIYFDLWVESVVRNGKNINGPSLKERIVRACREYRPLIYHAEVQPVQYILYKPAESAALRLLSDVDRLAGVNRNEVEQQVTAARFNSIISEAVRITNDLAFPS